MIGRPHSDNDVDHGVLVPRRPPWVASVEVEGGRVLAHEGCDRPVVLNEVGSVLWDWFDGRTSLRAVAQDLAAERGEPLDTALSSVVELVESLAESGFLIGDGLSRERTLPRRLDPPIDPSSCVGRAIGLGRVGTMFEVRVDGRAVLRFGSTLDEVSERLVSRLGQDVSTVRGDGPVRTIVLRASPGRVARMQQVFDTLGDCLYSSRDFDAAVEAFEQTVIDLLGRATGSDDGSTWVNCPALLVEGGVALLHPGLHSVIQGQLRTEVLARTQGFFPSAVLELRRTQNGFVGRIPMSDRRGPARDAPIVGILVPGGAAPTQGEAVRRLAHLAHRWDDAHLSLVAELSASAPIVWLDPDIGVRSMAAVLTSAVSG